MFILYRSRVELFKWVLTTIWYVIQNACYILSRKSQAAYEVFHIKIFIHSKVHNINNIFQYFSLFLVAVDCLFLHLVYSSNSYLINKEYMLIVFSQLLKNS